MIQIQINDKVVQIGQPVPKQIKSISVFQQPLPRVIVSKHQIFFIKKWLLDVIERCESEYISYNNILMKKDDLNVEFLRT